MALARVSLISELSLLPLKRMIQRSKGDSQQYQQATEAYCAQLRQLYRSSLRERRRACAKLRRARKEASALSEETFKLTLTAERELLGITLERSSLPLAELNDKVQLVRLTDGGGGGGGDCNVVHSDQITPSEQLLAHGFVSMVTEQQVRIKFQEPLRASCQKKADEEEPGSKESAEPKKEEAEAGGVEKDEICQEESPVKQEDAKEAKKEEAEIIHFKIRFDLSAHADSEAQREEETEKDKNNSYYLQLIDEVLRNFTKLKCNQALHKNLMGHYDETRSDLMINERARVLTALGGIDGELRLRPNAQQRAAVEQALKRRLTLIEGPAGSGKTLVAALIAANACRLRQSRVLVCSPLQTTVDKLTELLLSLLGDLQVVKLPEDASSPARSNLRRAIKSQGAAARGRTSAAKSAAGSSQATALRERRDSYMTSRLASLALGTDVGELVSDSASDEQRAVNEAADRCHLDKIVDDEIYLQAYARSKDTLGVHNHEQLHVHAYRMVTSCAPLKRREMELKMISSANVVCCTLVQAASYLLKGAGEFDLLVLDDQHVTSELDSLIAIMTKGIKQLTLVSDTRRRIRLARSRLSTNHYKQTNNNSSNDQRAAARSPSNGPTGETGVASGKPSGGSSRTASRNSNNSNSTLRRANSRQDSNSARSTPVSRSARKAATAESSSSADDDAAESDQEGGRAAGASSRNANSAAVAKSKCPPRVSLEPGNLFERLLTMGLPTVDMRVQYRCHATLANFFNHHFYAGRLKNDRRTNEKLTTEINSSLMLTEQNFSWLPNRKYLTALFQQQQLPTDENQDQIKDKNDAHHFHVKMIESKVTEILNRLLLDEHIQESRIGVIYNRHSLLSSALKQRNQQSSFSSDLKMSTIDGFIGQERDFIILVAASSGGNQELLDLENIYTADAKSYLGLTSEIHCDFRLHDAALNWAITRAKLGLFLVADANSGSGVNQAQTSSTNGVSSETTPGDQIGGEKVSNSNSNPNSSSSSDCGSWRELVKYYADNGLTVLSVASHNQIE